MNFAELAEKRSSHRKYSNKAVINEQITEILKTALLAPSACNSQPWKFVVVTGGKAKSIPPLLQELGINKFTDNVSSFIIVCETKAVLMTRHKGDSQTFAQIDIGLATAHLVFAAEDMGLSTCIIGSFNEIKLKELFNMPDDIKIRLVIALGYAEDAARAKTRKPFEETVSFNKW